MTGSPAAHNLIPQNLLRYIADHLRGTGSQAFICDLKVRAEATNASYYPGIIVTCKQIDPTTQVIDPPVLIVEVLSPSTKHIDRREKVAACRKIPTLREYLIVTAGRLRKA